MLSTGKKESEKCAEQRGYMRAALRKRARAINNALVAAESIKVGERRADRALNNGLTRGGRAARETRNKGIPPSFGTRYSRRTAARWMWFGPSFGAFSAQFDRGGSRGGEQRAARFSGHRVAWPREPAAGLLAVAEKRSANKTGWWWQNGQRVCVSGFGQADTQTSGPSRP